MARIRPSDMDTSRHFWNAFDHAETEVSANWLVQFLTETGDTWRAFTLDELQTFYAARRAPAIFKQRLEAREKALADQAKYPKSYQYIPAEPQPVTPEQVEPFYFNNLLATQWNPETQKMVPTGKYMVVDESKGTYEVTDLFILRCFGSAGRIDR